MATDRPCTEATFIKLADQEPFGVGGRRLCFTHPDDPGKCIKVLRQDQQRTIRGKRSGIVPARLRRRYDNNADEQQILEDLYRRIGPAMSQHLPVSHGIVATDLGPGLVLDLVRDWNGQISRSLRELISTGHELDEFRPAFEKFGQFLMAYTVLTRSLLDHNLAVQSRRDGSWQIYLIDGLGDPAFLPVARWVQSIGARKVRRRLAAAWPRFERFNRNGGVTPELIANSTWGQGFLNHRG
ncbi:YrbL family protein [Fuerstiella marisgermanici]|uniref:PhoP regulatory network protein n=1 Tax=Fuerstiella marisgermanici TaxID=1891926 RepID=A0A1P8W940_9PLAN|nr:YrbL family protein [Fuerstiella marisgermanici]APZ90582.1 PhoP regulatory network protein [Fuerstiella marisgermanici]